MNSYLFLLLLLLLLYSSNYELFSVSSVNLNQLCYRTNNNMHCIYPILEGIWNKTKYYRVHKKNIDDNSNDKPITEKGNSNDKPITEKDNSNDKPITETDNSNDKPIIIKNGIFNKKYKFMLVNNTTFK